MTDDKKEITVLKEFRPLNEEELSTDLTPDFNMADEYENNNVNLPAKTNSTDVDNYTEENTFANNFTGVTDLENPDTTDVVTNPEVLDEKENLNNEINYEEETAAEVAPLPRNVIPLRRDRTEAEDYEDEDTAVREKSGTALTGVILSVLSLFFLPYVLAPIGIVLGYMGYKRGDHSLGLWAMGLGVIGLLGTLIVSAFV